MIYKIPFSQFGFQFLEIESEQDPTPLLNTLPDRGFAIVGTRYPQRKSFDLLNKTMEELRGSDLVIVSGFARGIDSRAHELALEHRLKTVAVLGCGLNHDYPRENRHLRRRVQEEGGLIISPFERDFAPLPRNFLSRNQLIAFFARALWVVEASAISGTLNTARHASELNRDLYATPSFPNDPFFEGNEKLISGREPLKYPLADPFFGMHSLAKTWPSLGEGKVKLKKIDRKNLTRIQKWVSELEYSQGECQIQSLMFHAINQGITPGQFYHEYQNEMDLGKVTEDLLGRVTLR